MPERVVTDEEHWWDFLEHGFLDHHDDPTHFELAQLTGTQLVALYNLLDSELLEEEKQHTRVWLEVREAVHKHQPKYVCPCCGYKTLDQEPPGTYLACPICFWEDAGVQHDDPDYEGGANTVSLRQARKNFLEFGACENGR